MKGSRRLVSNDRNVLTPYSSTHAPSMGQPDRENLEWLLRCYLLYSPRQNSTKIGCVLEKFFDRKSSTPSCKKWFLAKICICKLTHFRNDSFNNTSIAITRYTSKKPTYLPYLCRCLAQWPLLMIATINDEQKRTSKLFCQEKHIRWQISAEDL